MKKHRQYGFNISFYNYMICFKLHIWVVQEDYNLWNNLIAFLVEFIKQRNTC